MGPFGVCCGPGPWTSDAALPAGDALGPEEAPSTASGAADKNAGAAAKEASRPTGAADAASAFGAEPAAVRALKADAGASAPEVFGPEVFAPEVFAPEGFAPDVFASGACAPGGVAKVTKAPGAALSPPAPSSTFFGRPADASPGDADAEAAELVEGGRDTASDVEAAESAAARKEESAEGAAAGT